MLEQESKNGQEHAYHPEDLLVVNHDEQAFHAFLQESKIFYSQASLPQSPDRLRATGEVVSQEGEPLTIKRGNEEITYDQAGRPVIIQSGGHIRKRRFNEKGFIVEEENSLQKPDGEVVGEVRRLSYKQQRGKLAVQTIDVYPFEVSKDGMKRLKTTFSVDLRGYDPVRPLKQSKPSFTWHEDK